MRKLTLFIVMACCSQLQAQTGNVERGTQLFMERGCYQCHNIAGQGGNAGVRLAPNLLPLPAFQVLVRTPVNQMPPYTAKMLSDAEVADIHAYLSTISQPPSPGSIPLLNR